MLVSRQFWRDIRSLGISESGKPTNIPAEIELKDGSISSDKGVVLNKWYTCFKSLLNNIHSVSSSQWTCQLDLGLGGTDSTELNVRITREEVESALAHAPDINSIGVDSLDPSYLNHEALIAFLVSFFNHCFISAKCPTAWKRAIIFPIPKRNSVNYCGISLQSTVLKLFIYILNKRLTA